MRDWVKQETGLILTGITVFGMLVAVLGRWVIGVSSVEVTGLVLVYAAGGIPATLQALSEMRNTRVLDIDLLMVVAAVAAFAVGAAMEGAVLLTLFSISNTLETRAMGRARRAVEALMALRPETALLQTSDGVRDVAVETLQPGDVVVLRPGARVPVDGVIVLGSGSLDESTITGESMPVHKAPGGKVFEATVNLEAVMEVSVTRGTADSTVARMITLVTEAQAAKAPSERFSAWFGQRYTVAVLVGSILALGGFLLVGRGWDDALYRAATLLVAASPCAVVISVPAAILSALSAAARGGVLFKGGAALETLAEVRAFAFDKTGTLTEGRPVAKEIVSLAPGGENGLPAKGAALEQLSEHPLAHAIMLTHSGCRPFRAIQFSMSSIASGIAGRASRVSPSPHPNQRIRDCKRSTTPIRLAFCSARSSAQSRKIRSRQLQLVPK